MYFQNYLVFIPLDTAWIDLLKSKGISEENIENKTKSDSNFTLTFVDHHLLPDISFNEPFFIKT